MFGKRLWVLAAGLRPMFLPALKTRSITSGHGRVPSETKLYSLDLPHPQAFIFSTGGSQDLQFPSF